MCCSLPRGADPHVIQTLRLLCKFCWSNQNVAQQHYRTDFDLISFRTVTNTFFSIVYTCCSCMYPCIYLFVYLSVCVSTCLSTCLSTCVLACLPVCLSVYLCVSLSLWLCRWECTTWSVTTLAWPFTSSISLPSCVSCVSTCLSVYMGVYDLFSNDPHVAIHKLYLSDYLPVCMTRSVTTLTWPFTSCTCVSTCLCVGGCLSPVQWRPSPSHSQALPVCLPVSLPVCEGGSVRPIQWRPSPGHSQALPVCLPVSLPVCVKVGVYDPFSDDPRLAIHKLYLCALSETLVIGGTAGQVIVLQFEREARHQVSIFHVIIRHDVTVRLIVIHRQDCCTVVVGFELSGC